MIKTRLISKQALEMFNVDYEEYLIWAKENNKNIYLNETKEEFFRKLKDKILIRNEKTNKLEEIKNVDY